MHSAQYHRCKFEISDTNITLVIDTNVTKRNTYDWQMKNIYDIIQIIDEHIYSRQMHMCITFKKSRTNILGVIDINVVKSKQMW